MRSSIAESSFQSKRCRQRRTIQGTLPSRREADIHIHTISTMHVQHAEHRTITINHCTSPVRVQPHCRMWRHLVQHATSCPEHIVVHDCGRRKRLRQPGEPLLRRGRRGRSHRQYGSREAQHRARPTRPLYERAPHVPPYARKKNAAPPQTSGAGNRRPPCSWSWSHLCGQRCRLGRAR